MLEQLLSVPFLLREQALSIRERGEEGQEKIAPDILHPSDTYKDYLKPQSEDSKYIDAPAMQLGLNADGTITTQLY